MIVKTPNKIDIEISNEEQKILQSAAEVVISMLALMRSYHCDALGGESAITDLELEKTYETIYDLYYYNHSYMYNREEKEYEDNI